MKLFHEVKNSIFLKLLAITNKIEQGHSYNYHQLLKELKSAFPTMEADYSLEESLIESMFDTSDKENIKLFTNKPVPFLPSVIEVSWLKDFLTSPINKALLSTEVYEKLNHALANTPTYLPNNLWERETNIGDDEQNTVLLQNLNLLQTALITQKKISYTNTTVSGKVYTAITSPHRLEYSLKENKYRLIIWHETEQRAIKINIANLSNLEILTTPIPPGEHELLQKFYEDQLASAPSLLLKLTLKNNAFERAFSLFANYDKTAYCENNDYILKISYHRFEEQELINAILSLGSAITVIAPPEFKVKIHHIYQQSYQQFCD